MMANLQTALLLLVLLFVQHAPPEVGGGETAPSDGRIAELRKQIADLRNKRNVKGLQQLGVQIKAELLAKKNPAYHQLILDLCLAMCSTRTTEPGINELVRDLAIAAIDTPGEKSASTLANLLLFLEGDFEYAVGRLTDEEWVKQRRKRAERWLKVCQSIRDQNAALPKPTELPSASVFAPEGLPNNVSPSAVKDPVLRKKYEEALAANARLAYAHRKKRDLEDAEESAAQRSQRYLTETFSRPPFRMEELAKLMEIYQFPKAKRVAILAEVRRREASKIERDTILAKMKAELGKVPMPAKLQYRVDGSPYRDVTFPLYVMQGSTVTFKSVATGDSWVWKGTSGATGKGETTTVKFPTLSKAINDMKTVIASRAGETITAHVIVYDLVPIYTPEHNFPGRDLDAYGICEFISLSFKTVPAGISESDLGGLRWLIEKGGGDLFGSAGGVSTYQCSDVGGSFVLTLQVGGRPAVDDRIRKK
jgi:hypothetical protein